jgi:flagella basal body P-ring formation protein FlgA
VAGSVVGAWLFIESNRTTEVFLVTQQDLASGSPLNIANLDLVELSLFGLAGAYLRPESLLEGAYLQRPIGSGEAIPLSAVTTQEQNNNQTKRVIIPLKVTTNEYVSLAGQDNYAGTRTDY